MKTRPLHVALAALLLVLGAVAAPARDRTAPVSGALMPLTPNLFWQYHSLGGLDQFEVICGDTTVFGRAVATKAYLGGPDGGLRNWWLAGPSGEVMLAGFTNANTLFSLGYEPPITICGGSPLAGDLWPTHVVAYSLPDLAVFAEFDIVYGLVENVSLTVPAGTFPSFGVGEFPPAGPLVAAGGTTFGLDGRRLGAGPAPAAALGSATATDWYSAGVGEVQYRSIDLFQLIAWGVVDATHASTWGALKERWR